MELELPNKKIPNTNTSTGTTRNQRNETDPSLQIPLSQRLVATYESYVKNFMTHLPDVNKRTAYKERTGIVIDYQHPETKGSFIVDGKTGKRYLDFHSGFGANPTGHNCPIMAAFKPVFGFSIANKLSLSDFNLPEGVAAMRIVLENLVIPNGFSAVHFIDTGSMAVLHMLTAALYTKRVADGLIHPPEFYTMGGFTDTFHGTSCGMTHGNAKVDAFPKPANRVHFPAAYTESEVPKTLAAIEAYCQNNPGKLAVFLFEDAVRCEPGDYHMLKSMYYGLRNLADKYGFYLAADAVQTFAATGKHYFGYQNIAPGFMPDLICACKKASVGVILMSKTLSEIPGNAFEAGGILDSTFGGDIGSITRLAVLTMMIKEMKLLDNIEPMGEILLNSLQNLKSEFPDIIKEVRGMGLIATVEFHKPNDCQNFNDLVFDGGVVLLGCRKPTILRLRPNLCVTKDEIQFAYNTMRNACVTLIKHRPVFASL